MNENKEIDGLIAFHLFGWRFFEYGSSARLMPPGTKGVQVSEGWLELPARLPISDNINWLVRRYSGTDWNTMKLVVEEMERRGFILSAAGPVAEGGHYHVKFIKLTNSGKWIPDNHSFGKTLPEAVCVAALQALEVKLSKEGEA